MVRADYPANVKRGGVWIYFKVSLSIRLLNGPSNLDEFDTIPYYRRRNICSNFYRWFCDLFYLIKNHKPEQVLYITFKYTFQRACLNYSTTVNI